MTEKRSDRLMDLEQRRRRRLQRLWFFWGFVLGVLMTLLVWCFTPLL